MDVEEDKERYSADKLEVNGHSRSFAFSTKHFKYTEFKYL